MDDDDKIFTVAIQNGQFILAIDADILDAHDPVGISDWVATNADRIDETARVALTHEKITAKEANKEAADKQPE